MGYWLILFIALTVGIIIVDNAFDSLRKKLPSYGLIAVLFFAGIGWGYYDYRHHTLANYEILPSYLKLTYLSGEIEYVAYQHIENIKFFVIGKGGSSCGLSFYIKGKDNLRTFSGFRCDDIRALQNQIFAKIPTQ